MILTKTLESKHQALRKNLLRADKLLNDQLRGFLSPYGVTFKQWDILKILAEHQEEKPPTILEVSMKMIDDSDTSRIIDRLVKKGFLNKIPCSMDKRVTRIVIEDSGRQLVNKITKNLDSLDQSFNHLNPSEIDQLNRLLKKLINRS